MAPPAHSYQLTDGLARLCLPQEFKDTYRNLAWANSICALFLAVGLVGLKAPRVYVRPISEPVEPQTVVLVTPEEPVKPETIELKPEDIPEVRENVDITPVQVVVAAADAPNVQFAVPVKVQGPVVVAASAAAASAPPANEAVSAPAPKATQFSPSVEGAQGGYYPSPDYPRIAIKNKYTGTVRIEFKVEPSGAITDLKMVKSSGYPLLDEAALDVVRSRWRFPSGPARAYFYDFVFKLN